MAGFSLLDDEELNVDISNGDILEIIPEEELDAHAPDEALETDVEDIGEIAEGLEACHDMLAMAAAANAMNPQAAQFAGLAIQLAERNIRGNFSEGLDKALDGKGKYGLEAFEDKASGTAYASYAMLGIMDTLERIWTRIVEFLTKWFDKVATWFNKYLSGAAFAKRKADAIKKKADKELGSVKKEQIEMNQTESLNLSLDGKFEPAPAIKATMDALKGIDCEKIVDASKDNLILLRTHLEAAKKGTLKDGVSGKSVMSMHQQAAKVASSMGPNFVVFNDTRFKESSTQMHVRGKNISGGQMVVITINGKEVDGASIFKSMSTSVVKIDVKAKGDRKVDALSTGAISSLADLCSESCSELIKFKDQYRDGKRDLASFKKHVDEIIKDVSDISTDKATSEIKSITSAYIGGMASTVSSPYSVAKAYQSQALTSINAALNYCLKSLSNHKKD
jgi:hypothetical protein